MAVLLLVAGTPGQPRAAGAPEGLPEPNFQSYASMRAAVAELDRSATTVAAEVGSRTVTWGDIADVLRNMPPVAGGIPIDMLYKNAAIQLLEYQALAMRGQSLGLDKEPAVQRRMRIAADQALANEVLRRSLAPHITEPALKALYDA